MRRFPKPPKKLEERFDLSGFIEYLQQTFQGFDNVFLRETVEKIVWNAHFFNFELRNNWIAYSSGEPTGEQETTLCRSYRNP